MPRAASPAQRGLQPHGVLAASPPIAGQQPGVVVDEREQVRLAAAHGRAVQRVAGPAGVRRRRPRTGRTPRWLSRPGGSSTPAGRSGAARCARPAPSPSGRAGSPRPAPRCARGTSLFNATASSSTSAGVRGPTRARFGDQGVEPAAAPVPDPPVDRDPGDPHRLPERALVLPLGERAHQPAPLLRRQLPVGGLADQRIPEQADRAGPFGPNPFFVMAERHHLLLHDSKMHTNREGR